MKFSELNEVVERNIVKLFRTFHEKPAIFLTEADVKCYLYSLLINEPSIRDLSPTLRYFSERMESSKTFLVHAEYPIIIARALRLTISKNTFTPHERLFLVFFHVKDPEKEEYDAYVIPSKVVDSKFSSQTQKGQKIYRLNVTSKKELREIESYTWNIQTDCFH